MYITYNSACQIVLHKQHQLNYNAEIIEKNHMALGFLTINIKKKELE